MEISYNDPDFTNGYVSLDALGAAALFDNFNLTSNVDTYYDLPRVLRCYRPKSGHTHSQTSHHKILTEKDKIPELLIPTP